MPPRLIIINGPIASGKSTLAMELCRQFRDSGRSAAVIDLGGCTTCSTTVRRSVLPCGAWRV
jgi:Ni2+-binding GTPase involved in maturation of urease and hydrogenase